MTDIVFATRNPKKSNEIKEILKFSQYNVLDLNDIGIDVEIEETGSSLHENALIKAGFLFERTGKPSFGEDSGLEVEALGNDPGVYSARYAGQERNDDANIQKLLQELNDNVNRSARFRTVIALVDSQGNRCFEGIIKGRIAGHKAGSSGFGYDPVFIPEGHDKTFAELTPTEKNAISHRAKALDQLIRYLNEKGV